MISCGLRGSGPTHAAKCIRYNDACTLGDILREAHNLWLLSDVQCVAKIEGVYINYLESMAMLLMKCAFTHLASALIHYSSAGFQAILSSPICWH